MLKKFLKICTNQKPTDSDSSEDEAKLLCRNKNFPNKGVSQKREAKKIDKTFLFEKKNIKILLNL